MRFERKRNPLELRVTGLPDEKIQSYDFLFRIKTNQFLLFLLVLNGAIMSHRVHITSALPPLYMYTTSVLFPLYSCVTSPCTVVLHPLYI